jgi:hypothetical protein
MSAHHIAVLEGITTPLIQLYLHPDKFIVSAEN